MQKLKFARTLRLIHLLLAVVLVLPACAWGSGLDVALVLSNSNGPYQAFVTAFEHKVAATAKVVVYDSPQDYASNHGHADIVVAVGTSATEAVIADPDVMMVAAMVPQSAYESLLNKNTHHAKIVSVIYLNQSWARQVDFLFATLPHARRIGVLHSVATRDEMRDIDARIKRHGGMLVAHENTAESALAKDLDGLLQHSDVLLAVPDNAIYSAGKVRNILLSTYRQNVPLLGWSQAFVNAGAVAALFSTPEQLAIQTGVTVLAYNRSAGIPASQYPAEFDIAINRQVARSLRLEIPSESEIRIRMMKGREREDD